MISVWLEQELNKIKFTLIRRGFTPRTVIVNQNQAKQERFKIILDNYEE